MAGLLNLAYFFEITGALRSFGSSIDTSTSSESLGANGLSRSVLRPSEMAIAAGSS